MDLTPFFESAVVKLNHNQTASLGDRTEYIGSSDVAGCIASSMSVDNTLLKKQYPDVSQRRSDTVLFRVL